MFNFFKKRIKETLNVFSKKVDKELDEIKEPKEEDTSKEKDKTEELEQKKESIEQEKKKNGFLQKIKEKITKTKINEEKFEDLFFDLELMLLENNVAIEVVEKIKDELKEKIVNKPIERKKISENIEKILKESIKDILTFEKIDLINEIKRSEKPYIIAFFGINGSGKTTTLAKIAKLLKDNNIKSVIAASDTFRAAAIDQLEEHAKKLGIKIIKQQYGADPTAVAFDAVNYAKAKNIDVVLIDTAGRLHSNKNLMDELKKLKRVIKPDLNIFVGESITGNDCIEQAKKFNDEIGIDAIILTKSDIDEKGGTIISVSYVTKKPIIYLGTGQDYNDLIEFDKNKIIDTLFS